jgi:protein TonB
MDVPSPKSHSTRPNTVGLASPVQQAELKLLLAGRWPPLKPLPVFKYETEEYRASIDFDKARGEWVCRKTSLPSHKIQELRGGLPEIITALPHAQAEAFAECAAAEQQEQELEKDASRRLQAILEWREHFESGALYSGLQNYLSKSQQDEINDSIRLTLTARQLQFTPKNVAYVFDALLKAGGKLATLIEIAQRKKTQLGAEIPATAETAAPDGERHVSVEVIPPARDRRLQMRTTPASRAQVELGGTNGGTVLNISETGMAVAATDPFVVDDFLPRIRLQLPGSGQSIEISAQIVWLAESKKSTGIRFIDLTAEARNQISNWIASEKPAPELDGWKPAPAASLVPAAHKDFPEEQLGSILPEQDQPSLPERVVRTASQPSTIVASEILDANPSSFVEDLRDKVHHHTPVGGFGSRVRTSKVGSSPHRIENSPSRLSAIEISGFHVSAGVFLFAVITLTVALTVERSPLGAHPRDNQKSTPAVGVTSSALLNRPAETTPQTSTPPANTFVTPAVTPPATTGSRSESPSAPSQNAWPEDPAPRAVPIKPSSATTTRSHPDSDNPGASPQRKGSTGLIARNAPPPANSQPALSPRAVSPISVAPANPAPSRVAPATHATPHLSSPSTILVSGPGDGSKPFRLTLPEKPIAASSSFAMTSQLSILVSPEPGFAPVHQPARLQAGELVSFVWPRYPGPGDRHGSAETVKVRTTIGEHGQVLDVKHVSGSSSLLPAAVSAVRQWRYKPTLLNSRPVQAQEDVTIEFRPPQHLPRVSTRHPSHK